MKIKNGFVLRTVGGEHVVVPVGEMSKAFHGMINLNETGAFMWRFFSEEHSLEEGVTALRAEYEVEEDRARLDVQKFINVIESNGFAE